MLFLKALSLGPLHGYGVIQRIRQLSSEMLNVEQGGSRQFQVGGERDRPPGEVLHLDQSGAQTIDGRRGKLVSARTGDREGARGDIRRRRYEAIRHSDRSAARPLPARRGDRRY